MPGQPLVDAHQVGMGETGNETWARNVVRVLEADGGQPVHWALTAAGAAELGLPGERTHLVGGSSARRLLVELPAHLRRLKAAAVMAQYTLPASRVPGVVVVHDVSFVMPEARAWIPPRSLLRYRATIGLSIRRARVVVVPTEHTRAQLIAHYPVDPGQVLLAPLALDPGLAGRLQRPRNTDGRHRVVLAVGTVLPRKNLPVAARAVAGLRAEGADVRLRLVGPVRAAGEPDLAAMRQVLGDALEVVGAVSEERLAIEYAGADALVYPSLHEGFGLPLLEAMAAGTPVVSSNATCLPEVAGDAALLVDPHDEAGWAAALRQVLEDPTELVARGRSRSARFTWEATGAVLRLALEQAIG